MKAIAILSAIAVLILVAALLVLTYFAKELLKTISTLLSKKQDESI